MGGWEGSRGEGGGSCWELGEGGSGVVVVVGGFGGRRGGGRGRFG